MGFVPNMTAPLVNALGKIIPPWNSFFQQFTQNPSKISEIDVTASPFSFQAGDVGQVCLAGGTVSLVELIRGNDIIISSDSSILVSRGDIVRVTYSVKPDIKFVPLYSIPNTR